VIAVEGSDGGPVSPPLAAVIHPFTSGECMMDSIGPSTVSVRRMCADLPYLHATVSAEPGAAPADVPLRLRVDYQVGPWGERRRAVAPLTVSIGQP